MASQSFRVLVAKRRDHGFQPPEGAVQPQRDQHEEEDDGPEDRPGHGGDGLGVDDEDEPRPLQPHHLDALVLDVRHVPQNWEDDESGQEARQTIDAAGEDRVSVAVVVEFVVAREGQQRAETGTQREEDLGGGVYPHFRVVQLVPLGGEVVADAVGGAGESHPSAQQDDQDDVGSYGGYPHRLQSDNGGGHVAQPISNYFSKATPLRFINIYSRWKSKWNFVGCSRRH